MATSEAGEFETALGRLEEIVRKLEGENVSLDDSVALFKEGKTLALKCETLLRAAQSAIETASGAESPAQPAARVGAAASLFSHDA